MTPKPLPAEDIAREMVPDPIMRDDHGRILAEMRYPGSTVGSVWPDFARPEEVDDLRRLLARLIEQTRAEGEAGAADELERLRAHIKVLEREQQPRDLAGLVHRYTDLWLDAARADGASERIAGPAADRRRSLAEIVSTLVDAVSDGRLLFAVKTLRSASGEDGDLFDLAARDLAAILREGRVSTSNGPLVLDPPTIRGEPITITGVSVLDEPEDGYTHAVVYYGPGGIAGSALVTAADAARIGDRGRASQQPRDLAGRIRALGDRWLRIWLELGQFDREGDDVLRACLDAIREFYRSARGYAGVRPIDHVAFAMRHTFAVGLRRDMFAKLADELEAIVRDAEEQR